MWYGSALSERYSSKQNQYTFLITHIYLSYTNSYSNIYSTALLYWFVFGFGFCYSSYYIMSLNEVKYDSIRDDPNGFVLSCYSILLS